MTVTIHRGDLEIEVEGYVSDWGSEGRYHGPPERCYPAEAPGVEIESAIMFDGESDVPVVLTSAEQREAARLIAEAEREASAEAWAESRMGD